MKVIHEKIEQDIRIMYIVDENEIQIVYPITKTIQHQFHVSVFQEYCIKTQDVLFRRHMDEFDWVRISTKSLHPQSETSQILFAIATDPDYAAFKWT